MRVEALADYGLNASIVRALSARLDGELFEIQARAVAEHGLLAGRGLLVCAPTGSGKTLIGEIAALHQALQGRRAVMAVPTRSLADEKWLSLSEHYADLGLRTVLATAERRAMDRQIARGEFDVCVTVPEKLLSFFEGTPPTWLVGGTLVVDELQLLSDPQRGAAIEELLLQCRRPELGVQIIGLSAVLRDTRALSAWLGTDVLKSMARPVELRTGVLLGGRFMYREHNTGLRGEEQLYVAEAVVPDPMAPPVDRTHDTLMQCIDALVARGESVLVFTRDKLQSFALAMDLVGRWPAVSSGEAREEVAQAEHTRAAEILGETLPYGIAVHNADLTLELRSAIERAARRRELRVVCATTTLAMGVNLAVDNVIVDARRWAVGESGGLQLVHVSQSELENMGGRAGRVTAGRRQEAAFGRAIVIAASEIEREAFDAAYVAPGAEPLEPALWGEQLYTAACRTVGRHGAAPLRVVEELTTDSLTARIRPDRVQSARDIIERMVSEGLAELTLDGVTAGPDLQLAGRFGLAPQVIARLRGLGEHLLREIGFPPAVLYRLAEAAGPVLGIPLIGPERGQAIYGPALLARLDESGFPIQALTGDTAPPRLDEAAAKAALLATDWIGDEATADLERRYRALAGTIARVMRDLARVCRAAAHAAHEPGPATEAITDRLLVLADRIGAGCAEAGLELLSVAGTWVARDQLRALVSAGVHSVEDVIAAGPQSLGDLVPIAVVQRLTRAARAYRAASRVDLFAALPTPQPKPEPALHLPEPGRVLLGGVETRLPLRQWRLLHALAAHPSRCVPYRALYGVLDEAKAPTPARVRDLKNRLVRELRKAAGDDAASMVKTLSGKGLMLDLPADQVRLR